MGLSGSGQSGFQTLEFETNFFELDSNFKLEFHSNFLESILESNLKSLNLIQT